MSVAELEPAVHAVTFDLWATLFEGPEAGGAARHRVRATALSTALADHGRAVSRERLDGLMRGDQARFDRIWRDEHRTQTNAERIRLMMEALGAHNIGEAARSTVERAFAESIWAGPPALAAGAVETLQVLQDAGVRLGVVSDTSFTNGALMRQLMARAGVLDFFEVLVFSDEAGVSKPSSVLFEQALVALETDAAHAAHIGDNPYTDILGARGAGMKAVLYRPSSPRDAPTEHQPDAVIQHLDELQAWARL